jgi:hypothetical protein
MLFGEIFAVVSENYTKKKLGRPEWHSRCSDSLRAGPLGDRILVMRDVPFRHGWTRSSPRLLPGCCPGLEWPERGADHPASFSA